MTVSVNKQRLDSVRQKALIEKYSDILQKKKQAKSWEQKVEVQKLLAHQQEQSLLKKY